MKKLLFSTLLAALLLAAGKAAAGSDPLQVVSGNLAYLNLDATALVRFDYSQTMVEDKTLDQYLQSRGDDFVRDWPSDCKKAALYFINRVNSKNKKGGGIQTTDDGPAHLMLLFHVKTLDMGNGGSTFIPMAGAKAGGVIMNGTLEIINLSTNAVVCTVNIVNIKGQGHVSETVRLGLCYFEMATQLLKMASKSGSAPAVTLQAVSAAGGPAAAPAPAPAPRTPEPQPAPVQAQQTMPAQQTAPAQKPAAAPQTRPAQQTAQSSAPVQQAAPAPRRDSSEWDTIICPGEDIRCRVIKVGQKEIEYKRADNLDGPTYTISRSKAEKIIYSNGYQEDVKISTFDFLKKKK